MIVEVARVVVAAVVVKLRIKNNERNKEKGIFLFFKYRKIFSLFNFSPVLLFLFWLYIT